MNKANNKNKIHNKQTNKFSLINIIHIFIIVGFVFSVSKFYNKTKIGFNNTIIEQHAFRQTQTGLTALYFVKEGFKFNYITPMYGFPWVVPMEWPIYQYCVALYKLMNPRLSLDVAGRRTSLFFFYISFIPIYFIIRRITKDNFYGLIPISFALFHPLCIYWSRSFLIETTALCLNLFIVWLGIELLTRAKWYIYIGLLFFAIIAPASKSTTGLVTLILLSFFYLQKFIIDVKDGSNFFSLLKNYLPKVLISFVLPVLIILTWTFYSDDLKSQHYTTEFWVSTTPEAKAWNYGTLDQKTSLDVWNQINGFEFYIIYVVMAISILAFLLNNSYKFEILFFTIGGLAGPMIFTNLFYIHDYYSYANSLLYCIAIGFFIIGLFEHQKSFIFKPTGFLLCFAFAYYLNQSYLKSAYLYYQKNNNTYFNTIANNVKAVLKEDESFVFFGMIGDPFVPYYAERKAVCMQPYYINKMKKDTLRFLNEIKPSNIKALVLCDVGNQDLKLVNKTLEYFNLNPKPANADFQQMGYYMFTSNNKNQ